MKLRIVAIVTGLLAVGAAGIMLTPRPHPLPAPSAIVSHPLPALPATAMRGLPATKSIADVVVDIVARNPFRERRRSADDISEKTVDTNASTPPAAPPRQPVPQFRLSGVISSADASLAAIEIQGAGVAHLLHVGDVIAGFRVMSVTSTGVRLMRADTTVILKLQTP